MRPSRRGFVARREVENSSRHCGTAERRPCRRGFGYGRGAGHDCYLALAGLYGLSVHAARLPDWLPDMPARGGGKENIHTEECCRAQPAIDAVIGSTRSTFVFRKRCLPTRTDSTSVRDVCGGGAVSGRVLDGTLISPAISSFGRTQRSVPADVEFSTTRVSPPS